jgi:poly(A) polymerase
MSEAIPNAPFLTDPRCRQVIDALQAARPACVRFVGGCVRDALMRRPAGDVDLATQLTPDAVIAALAAAGLRHAPTGLAHGTVTAIVEGRPFEITSLRRDVATDGRRAVVAFTEDWALDAARRDFHLNAIYCDPDGVLFDPTGQGVADAKAGRVRFVGDPATRIAEDGLRILRFFRFNAWHGRGALDGPGLQACAAGRAGLAALSVERVWSELKKLLAAPDPGEAVRAMATTGILTDVLPEAECVGRLDALLAIEGALFLDPDPMQRLMALLPRDPAVAKGLASRLRLSGAEAGRLTRWAGDATRIVSHLSMREVRAALYRLGDELWADRVRLAWAGDAEPRRASQWRALLALSNGFTRPRFPLDGAMVLAAGARPGPAVGEILAEVERWWVDNDFIEDELSLIERLKAVTQALG